MSTDLDVMRLRPHLRTRARRVILRACLGCGKPCASVRCPDCQLPSYSDPEYQANRRIVLLRDRNCWRCGKPGTPDDPITADHVRARIDGGGHELSNLAGAHASCNSSAGARRAA